MLRFVANITTTSKRQFCMWGVKSQKNTGTLSRNSTGLSMQLDTMKMYSITLLSTLKHQKSVFRSAAKNSVIKSRNLLKNSAAAVNQTLNILSEQFSLQFKGLLVQRSRRVAKTLSFQHQFGYSKLYYRYVVSILRTRFRFSRNPKIVALFSAVAFNWKEQQITQEQVLEVESEIELISRKPCKNGDIREKTSSLEKHFEQGWEKVIEKPNILCWRQPVPGSKFYKYKVYGCINDIPARAFYHAQIDIKYRKKWDKHIIKLEVIDKNETGNQVVHWVTHFPYPMYPREYVYIRKFKVDREKNLMYTMGHSCKHPSIPANKKYVRVDTYLSNMVIRPYTTFDENGFDYLLTYYDEPKSSYSTAIYNYLAASGVPDFQEKMYDAARYLHSHQDLWPQVD